MRYRQNYMPWIGADHQLHEHAVGKNSLNDQQQTTGLRHVPFAPGDGATLHNSYVMYLVVVNMVHVLGGFNLVDSQRHLSLRCA
jgi:hypothetical protein